MALIHCNFFSHTLGVMSALDVILPQPPPPDDYAHVAVSEKKYPTLYLLHGLTDDHTVWQRRTAIECYVENTGLAVVMPAVQRSFYTDMAHGYKYWTYLSQEVPFVARSLFRLSEKRDENFVAGLSMGGYGAFKLALRCPERFAAAASLSGALDIVDVTRNPDPDWLREQKLIFGNLNKVSGGENDLFALAQRLVESGVPCPALFSWCGTEDFLIEHNRKFASHCRDISLPLEYSESPGGHEWQRWDEQIQKVLKWITKIMG
jgi:putative tributyrin esterase